MKEKRPSSCDGITLREGGFFFVLRAGGGGENLNFVDRLFFLSPWAVDGTIKGTSLHVTVFFPNVGAEWNMEWGDIWKYKTAMAARRTVSVTLADDQKLYRPEHSVSDILRLRRSVRYLGGDENAVYSGEWVGTNICLTPNYLVRRPIPNWIVETQNGEKLETLSAGLGLVNGLYFWEGTQDFGSLFYEPLYGSSGYVYLPYGTAGQKYYEVSWTDADGNTHYEGTRFYEVQVFSGVTSGTRLIPRGSLRGSDELILKMDEEGMFVLKNSTDDWGEYVDTYGNVCYVGCRRWNRNGLKIVERAYIEDTYKNLEDFKYLHSFRWRDFPALSDVVFTYTQGRYETLKLVPTSIYDGYFESVGESFPARKTHPEIVFQYKMDLGPWNGEQPSKQKLTWRDYIFQKNSWHNDLRKNCGGIFDLQTGMTPNGEEKCWVGRYNPHASWFETDLEAVSIVTTWEYFVDSDDPEKPTKAAKIFSFVDYLEMEKNTPPEIVYGTPSGKTNVCYYIPDADLENACWILSDSSQMTEKWEFVFTLRNVENLVFAFEDYVQGSSTEPVYMAYTEVWQ